MAVKLVRLAFVFLAIGLVVGVIFVVDSERNLYVVTSTESFTTTTVITTTSLLTLTSVVNSTRTISIVGNVELTGSCMATSYFSPDTVSSPETAPTTDTLSYTTYSASTYVNSTGIYVVTTTSYDLNDRPSNGWTVTVCTYQP
jgi:hypothetical protein